MARRVQERVLRHDALILDSAVDLAADLGWSGVLFPRVVETTGLSERPLRDRYRDRLGLAQQVWWQRLESPVLTAMRDLIESVPEPGERISAATLAELLEPFTDPDERFGAAAELIVVARYQPSMCTAVTGTLGAALAMWTDPRATGMTKALAARRAYVAALALGLLASSRLAGAALPDLRAPLGRLARALSGDARPTRLPAAPRQRFDPLRLTDGQDEAWEALLQMTVVAIGRLGYDGATFDVLTDMAGVSRGFIQGHYSTKREFFMDVAERTISATGMMQPAAGDAERSEFAPGAAAAIEIRETMRPERQGVRTVVLEQLRLAWHDDAFSGVVMEQMEAAVRQDRRGSSAQASHCIDQALLWGAGLLAELHPASWELPYSVVTEALDS